MKKLTRRAYNRKIMMFGAAIFMSVAMISTGFAAWLISSADPVNLETPVTVAIVTDETVKITVDNWDGETWTGDVLSFDADNTDDASKQSGETRAKDLIMFSGDAETEGANLTMTLSGTVTNVQNLADNAALSISVVLPESIQNAITAGYLVAPAGWTNTAGTLTKDIAKSALTGAADTSKTFSETITFTWGAAFGNVNPCFFYDSDKTGTATTTTGKGGEVAVDEVVAQMTAFNNMLHGQDAGATLATAPYAGTIAITITPNLKGAQ